MVVNPPRRQSGGALVSWFTWVVKRDTHRGIGLHVQQTGRGEGGGGTGPSCRSRGRVRFTGASSAAQEGRRENGGWPARHG
eukprot:COSAG02_NODE_1757_length_11046_cov_9.787613_5_plen_81_part_00